MHMKSDVKKFLSVEKLIKKEKKKEEITLASEFIWALLSKFDVYEFFYSSLDVVIAMYALLVIQENDFNRYQRFLFMILLCSVHLLDFLHHLMFVKEMDGKSYWKIYFDACLSITIIIMSGYLFVSHNIGLMKIWGFIAILKLFRIFLFYFRFDQKDIRKSILYPCYKFISDITLQLLVIFVIFASLGLNLFGGNINSFSLDLYNEDRETEYDYDIFNFNTFANSFIFLFLITLNNDWPLLANLCIINHGKGERRLLKFIFILFKLIVNYILLNSVIAFVIEIFYEHEKKTEKEGI